MIIDNIELPIIALRGIVAFPKVTFTFDLSRLKSIEALESAMLKDQTLFLTAQKDASKEDIHIDDLYNVGVIIKVKQVIKLPGNLMRVIAEGLKRASVIEFYEKNDFFRANIKPLDEKMIIDEKRKKAIVNMLQEAFEKYSALNGRFSPDFIMEVLSADEPGYLSDFITSKINIPVNEKQSILEELNNEKRSFHIIEKINYENELLEIQKDIASKVKANIDKSQKEYFLREQIKVIQNELGEKDGINADIDEYTNKMNELKLPEYVKERLENEINRLKKISSSSAESVVSRDYIELILGLPWSKETKESINLTKAESILNNEHFGLEKVKERIIEFLAVRKNTNNLDAPIICLVGPPGVGKTSIAKSVAKALNRKYARISLGGIRDEAEIRGHRKTYVGAMPGRIITALKQAGTKNPLILFDEIDKMSSDYKGDPSSAMLEVLDSEQNFTFRDNYLEMPFDISNVLFMCTANDLSSIPRPLKDRLEIITLSSYTHEEKKEIALKFLIDKQIKKHGLKKSNIKIKPEAVDDIIKYYTRESGVRQLEREIGHICRKAVKKILVDGNKTVNAEKSNIEDFLGKRKYHFEKIDDKNEIGVVCGLAWTSVGGATFSIEVNTMKGKGDFSITGNIGKVMDESAKAAVSYVRSNCKKLGIRENFYKDTDIHIHIPEGAVPKDGPSAGVTIVTALISVLSKKPVRCDTAMTGEITIRGKVLPIGGLKEKVLAAKRLGIKKIIIPAANSSDMEELPEYAKKEIEFVLADKVDDVLKNALVHEDNLVLNDFSENNSINSIAAVTEDGSEQLRIGD